MSLYMAEVELLAELKLAVGLVVQLVQVLQEGVRSRGQWEWMRKIGVNHNTTLRSPLLLRSRASRLYVLGRNP